LTKVPREEDDDDDAEDDALCFDVLPALASESTKREPTPTRFHTLDIVSFHTSCSSSSSSSSSSSTVCFRCTPPPLEASSAFNSKKDLASALIAYIKGFFLFF
jgi:hypothetical protein